MITEKYGRIIFLHIPRTGGMSLRQIMDGVYGRENIGHPSVVGGLAEEDKSRSAFYGHFSFGLHRQLGPIAWLQTSYITIMREPGARLMSEYIRNKYRERLGLTPVQFAERVREVAYGWDKTGDNLQVRMLSGAAPGSTITMDHVYRALGIVREHFAYVGFTHRYDELVQFLRNELRWDFGEVPHINASAKYESLVSEEEAEDLRMSPRLKFDYMLWRSLCHRT